MKAETEKRTLMDNVVVFVGCYTTGEAGPNLYVYRLDLATGQLAPLSSVRDVRNPAWLDLHPNERILYSVCDVDIPGPAKTGGIATYEMDARTGSLQLLGQQPTKHEKPCHVSIHPSGACLLVANYPGGNACVLPVLEDFTAGPVSDFVQYEGRGPNLKRQDRPHAHSGMFSPDGRFAYVQDLGTDHIWQYRIDAVIGTLHPLDPPTVDIAPGSGPRHLVFHPNGRYAYLINELLNTITCLSFDTVSGQLTPFHTVPALPADFTGENYCADIHITPDGKFLYGSNRGHDSLVMCRIDETSGRLDVIGHQPSGGHWPRGFGLDPTGRYAVVGNERGNNLLVFAIDAATGLLRHTGCTLELPAPVCVEFRVGSSY